MTAVAKSSAGDSRAGPKARVRSIYAPTRRCAAAFAAGSLWFFAVPWAGMGMVGFGLGYVVLLIVMVVMDCQWVRDSRGCTASRARETVLSLGEQNPIWLEVTNGGRRPMHVALRDEPPLEFQAIGRVVELDVRPDETLRGNYKVMPPERGDYLFGDLYVRYTSRSEAHV